MQRKFLRTEVIDQRNFSEEDQDLLFRFYCKCSYHNKLHDSWVHGGNYFNKERAKEVEENWEKLQLEELKAWSIINKYENVLLINGKPLETIYTKP